MICEAFSHVILSALKCEINLTVLIGNFQNDLMDGCLDIRIQGDLFPCLRLSLNSNEGLSCCLISIWVFSGMKYFGGEFFIVIVV